MRLVYVPPLDDAYFFVNQAKGLPTIASSHHLRRKYLTACILLSWVALEVAVSHRAQEFQRRGLLPRNLRRHLVESVEALLVVNHKHLDVETFTKLRKTRNELAHPKSDEQDLDLSFDVAAQSLEFCAMVIQDLYYPMKLVYGSIERG